MRSLFRLKKDVKGIKNIRIRNIRNLFEYEREGKIIINQYEHIIFGLTIILNIKVTAIEIKLYQLKNILIILGHV